MTITAAADGSALGNPGPMGWAWYIDDDRWAAGGSPHGTNNQGELQAVLELLRATAGIDDDLVVECDSRYVIDAVTKWMPGWKRKGWRKADGKPVMNRELLQGIDDALHGRTVSFSWIKGHSGHPLNEAADRRANGAAQAFQRGDEPQRGPGLGGAGLDEADPAGGPTDAPVRGTSAPTQETSENTARAASRSAAIALWEAGEELALFAEPEVPVELRLSLTPDEHARLRARAAAEGVSAEEALRRLI
ncbi:ribonuclease HI [Microbacterium betulae]|uniref:Ribonuclease H n=1 Tax=Microbacterium betulae TaxID=2981139 RepID=A0AA97I847_9MICO|nr:ribonuclease H [Microbacterium sp. AB]WOF24302.1 ribonuclease HI [Microbacterium sp. AB]